MQYLEDSAIRNPSTSSPCSVRAWSTFGKIQLLHAAYLIEGKIFDPFTKLSIDMRETEDLNLLCYWYIAARNALPLSHPDTTCFKTMGWPRLKPLPCRKPFRNFTFLHLAENTIKLLRITSLSTKSQWLVVGFKNCPDHPTHFEISDFETRSLEK